MPEIRVALVGVGNSASALVQGTQYYKDAKEDTTVPGLMHVNYGGYHIRDIHFVAAFEVNKAKIGKDLSEAIWVKPNCCEKFANVPTSASKFLRHPSSTALHHTCAKSSTSTTTAKPPKTASSKSSKKPKLKSSSTIFQSVATTQYDSTRNAPSTRDALSLTVCLNSSAPTQQKSGQPNLRRQDCPF